MFEETTLCIFEELVFPPAQENAEGGGGWKGEKCC